MNTLIFLIMITPVISSGAGTNSTLKTTTMVNSGTAVLFTTIYPRDNSETVILLHGGPGVPDDMEFETEFLREYYQVITFHQRGTAKSPVRENDFTIESYISDIDNIAAYFDLEKFHLMGHSWGGLYAQIYTQKRPQRILSLFLSSPGSGTGIQWKETEKEVMAFNKSKTNSITWLFLGWNSLKGIFGSNIAYQNVFRQVLRNYNHGFSNTGRVSIDLDNVKAEPVNSTRKQLNKFPVLNPMPTADFKITITYGDRDIYGKSKRYLVERYPNADIFTIENCGHLPALQNGVRYAEVLRYHYAQAKINRT